MLDTVIMTSSIAAGGAVLSLIGLGLSLNRSDGEPAPCEHAKPGMHCGEPSCLNNTNTCIRCNTPEDVPWYEELEHTPLAEEAE